LIIDSSKLDDKEKSRLELINKITREADEMARAGGFNFNDNDDDDDDADSDDNSSRQIAVKDTKWSGQSDLDVSIAATNSWQDIMNRKVLAAGDAVALIAFAAIGRSNHGEGIELFNTLSTAAPFLLSWFFVNPFFGTFSRKATSSKAAVPIELLGGWAVSIPLGLALRGIIKGGVVPPTPFIVVSMVATYVFLCLWRIL
jgi:hypothetical protein